MEIALELPRSLGWRQEVVYLEEDSMMINYNEN
jgi:hypothetical protein